MITMSDALELVAKFEKTRILVIGDICLDQFIRGDVTRISSEAPIPVMVARQENSMLGQAGNTLSNLSGLEAQASIISVIGNDSEGQMIRGLVNECGADGDALIVSAATPSTVKTRYMSAHQQVFRVDTQPVQSYSAETENAVIEQISKMLPNNDAVILSDYGYGLLSDNIIRTTIGLAFQHSIPVLVDPRGSDLSKYRGATVATPNKKELAEATGGMPVDTDENVILAASCLMAASGIQNIVATRSQDGMSVISSTNDPVHLRTTAREVYDVSGAGDTVISTIAAGLAAGASLVDAATIANVAAGIVVGKVGTAPVRKRELLDALSSPESVIHPPENDHAAEMMDWDAARDQIEKWRARGLKIGFTNGCFDIVHAGHVNYLNKARSKCDRLVLGLNHDKSIRILKGPTRPVNNQESRATVIGGLSAIDLVVFFGAEKEGEDNSAGNLIRAIKPDIYFKGNDYTIEQLPEAPIMASFGGKIELIPLTEGLSTTKIIEKMKVPSGNAA